MPPEPVELEAGLPFMGSWDCDGMARMTFRPDGYDQGGVVLTYAQLEEIVPGRMWGIVMTDGYVVTVEADGSDWLTWHSPQSGDTFRCRRIEEG
ncbi:hypothetical protein [Wenxinia saemankumensis]|uniref:hypothetical protein n=1 Tax=Wenxinia saemankumensis TaxID=1447782 RepID=UPI0011151FD9|nr:hypothetical protein [Wenxinia saemankumensis]